MMPTRFISEQPCPCKRRMLKNYITILILILFFMPAITFSQEYTIGEGDVLEIKVYENDDLSTTVRVSSNSTIRVPLLGEISIKDLTVSQISSKIEGLYADGYLVSPQVDVFIKEHRSKKAIILGQVKNPGQYELRGKVTILEFISTAGGLTTDAGGTATIKRTTASGENKDQIVLDLEKLIKKGDVSLNIAVQDNDSIYISKAKTYYVSGEVVKPNQYVYEQELTVIKAITMAGGFSKIAAKDKVQIIRLIKGQKKVLEKVNMDEPVLPDDVIVVPESFF